PSQTWRIFLQNHLRTMVSIDFFTVPTIHFQVLYVFLVLAHDRRRVVHFNVTSLPRPSGRRSSCGKHFRSITRRNICFVTGTGSLEQSSASKLPVWEWRKCYQRRDHHGSELTWNVSSARFVVSASITLCQLTG